MEIKFGLMAELLIESVAQEHWQLKKEMWKRMAELFAVVGMIIFL